MPTAPLAMPPRPKYPLTTWQIIKSRGENSLALCDEALFDELIAERRFLGHRVVVVSDPDGVRRVLSDNFRNYHGHEFKKRPLRAGLGTGSLINDGELWQRHRNLLNPILDYRSTLPEVPMLVQWSEVLAEYLAQLPPDQPINIGNAISSFVTHTISQVFAGDDPEVEPMIFRMAKYPGRRRLSDYVRMPMAMRPRSRQIRAEAHQWYPLLDRLIAERRDPAYAGGRDLLWRMAHARTKDGDSFGHSEIRDEVLTLCTGAVETTLRPMCWIWYLLALHPWAEARLHEELDQVLGDRAPTPEILARLTYLRQVVDETMRVYPPVPVIVRKAVAEDTVCGHPVRRGSTVVVAPWIIHRHRRLWDEPDRFAPERFAPANARGRSRYSYLPFSVGPRTCVAGAIAMMQILVGVAVLARRLRFRVVPDHPIEPTGWTTLRPDKGMLLIVERRR